MNKYARDSATHRLVLSQATGKLVNVVDYDVIRYAKVKQPFLFHQNALPELDEGVVRTFE